MMTRREFARRCALIAAGVVAADQLDVLEMLAPRRLFVGAAFTQSVPQVTTLAELYAKVQSEVVTALRLSTDEYDWFRSFGPRRLRDLPVIGL